MKSKLAIGGLAVLLFLLVGGAIKEELSKEVIVEKVDIEVVPRAQPIEYNNIEITATVHSSYIREELNPRDATMYNLEEANLSGLSWEELPKERFEYYSHDKYQRATITTITNSWLRKDKKKVFSTTVFPIGIKEGEEYPKKVELTPAPQPFIQPIGGKLDIDATITYRWRRMTGKVSVSRSYTKYYKYNNEKGMFVE